MRQAIAAILLALPLVALAQGEASPPPAAPAEVPAPPAPPAPVAAAPAPAVPAPAPAAAAPIAAKPAVAAVAAEPDWSFGAGVGFGSGIVYVGSFYLGTSTAAPQLSRTYWPTLVTSLERRIGGKSWLVLGGSGWFSDERAAWENVDLGTPAEVQRYGVQISAGVRQVVTPATAIVDVSILALAEGGVAKQSLDRASGGTDEEQAWIAGGSLGFAVERTLVDRLSVRVASPLVAVRYWSSELTAPASVRVTSSAWTADLYLAPRLELRLAF